MNNTILNNINWKVRIKNKTFWISLIPAILLLIQSVAEIFGINVETQTLNNQLLEVINSLFIILALLGIVVDPTTEGIVDSDNAMQYTEPKRKGEAIVLENK